MSETSNLNTSEKRSVPALIPIGSHTGRPPIPLNKPVYVIGSRSQCRIHLMSSTVSKCHVLVVQTRHSTYIRDLCSREKTFVNGQAIREHVLEDGDEIQIGKFLFRYQGPRQDHGAEPEAIPATLDVTDSPIPVPVESRVMLIGRRPTCDVPLTEESVSTAHAVIFQWEGKRFVRDLYSRTGTFLNGRKVHEKPLSPGDVIRAGETEIRYNPSTEGAVAELVLSASDSVIADAPDAEEIDLGIDLSTAAAEPEKPLEAEPAKPVEVEPLPLAIADDLVEQTSHHDTAAIPLPIEIEPEPAPEPPKPAELELPRRGWRSKLLKTPEQKDMPGLEVVPQSEAPLQQREPAPELQAVDLSSVRFDSPEAPAEPLDDATPTEAVDAGEKPLIASDTLELAHDELIQEAPANVAPVPPIEVPPVVSVTDVPVEAVTPIPEPAPPEVLAPSDPTPESAQVLDLSSAAAVEPVVPTADALSDSTFGRAVEEFTSDTLPLVESAPTEPARREQDLVQDVVLPDESEPRGLIAEMGPIGLNLTSTPPTPLPIPDTQPESAGIDLEPREDVPLVEPPQEPLPAAPLDAAPPAPVIPRPPRPARRKRDHKPTVIRNAFGQNPDAPPPEQTVDIPPFAGSQVGADAPVGLSGIASPAASETDVFAPLPEGPAIEDVFAASTSSLEPLELEAPDPATEAQVRSRRRGRRPIADSVRLPPAENLGIVTVPPRRPNVSYDTSEMAQAPAVVRRRKLRRVPILVMLMLGLIGAAWAACMTLIPVRTRVEASLRFNNFDALTIREQREWQARQRESLRRGDVRNTAVRIFKQKYGQDTPPGFLADPIVYDTIVDKASWPETRKGVFVLSYDGTDAINDPHRIEAMAMALHDSNAVYVETAAGNKRRVDELERSINGADARIQELSAQIEKDRALGERAPTIEVINQLQSDVERLEKLYNDAIAARKNAQAEVDRLDRQAPGADGADSGAVDALSGDEQLKSMQRTADAIAAELSTKRTDREELAEQSRKALDAAMDQFQKQVALAQERAKDNPELAAYIQSARDYQIAIKDITEQSLRRNQQLYGNLLRFKQTMAEKMEARKAELWASDPQLKELNERREIAVRRLNAARGSGLDKDASDLENELKLIDNLIAARQETIGPDTVLVELNKQFQPLIEQLQRDIDEQRKSTDEKMEQLAGNFARSQPAVEKLPEEQKQLAADMEARLAEIASARKTYMVNAEAAGASSDKSIEKLQTDLVAVQAAIDARKKQLTGETAVAAAQQAEQSRRDLLESRRKELAAFTQAETDAQTAFFARQKELREARALRDQIAISQERLEKNISEKDRLQRQQEVNQRTLESARKELERTVEPVAPVAADPVPLADQRMLYGAAATAGLLLLFGSMIVMTLMSAARDTQYAYGAFEPSAGTADEPPGGDATVGSPADPADAQRKTASSNGTSSEDENETASLTT